jgi:hypothetical protein
MKRMRAKRALRFFKILFSILYSSSILWARLARGRALVQLARGRALEEALAVGYRLSWIAEVFGKS